MAQTGENSSKSTSFVPVGQQATSIDQKEEDEDGQKVVDEIDSLCMNCKDDVRTQRLAKSPLSQFLMDFREQLDCC